MQFDCIHNKYRRVCGSTEQATEMAQQKCSIGGHGEFIHQLLQHTIQSKPLTIQSSVEHKYFWKFSLSLNLHKFCECNVRIVNYK